MSKDIETAARSAPWFRVKAHKRLGEWLVAVTDSVERLMTPDDARELARQLNDAADGAEGRVMDAMRIAEAALRCPELDDDHRLWALKRLRAAIAAAEGRR